MVDNNGVLVADADEMVTVNVSGEATLVGLDSGDIYYTGLFKTNKRKVFNGKLLVAVQSTYKAGTSTIELTSAKTGAVKLILNSVK
jgi:beta-galactosidase